MLDDRLPFSTRHRLFSLYAMDKLVETESWIARVIPRILLMTRNKRSFHSPNTVLPQEPQSSYCTISLLSSLLEPHPSWSGGNAAHSPAVMTLLQRNRVYPPMARKFLPYHFRLFRKETKGDQGIEQELTTSNALQEPQEKRKRKKEQRKENGMIT